MTNPLLASFSSTSKRKALVSKHVARWKSRLGLDHYTIQQFYLPKIQDSDELGDYVGGRANGMPGILRGQIEVSDLLFQEKGLREKDLSVLCGHEMTHILFHEYVIEPIEEMINMLPYPDEVKGMYMKRIEDGTERMTRALEGAFREVPV